MLAVPVNNIIHVAGLVTELIQARPQCGMYLYMSPLGQPTISWPQRSPDNPGF